jgi:Na+/H+-dicarboxylate symporter
MKIHVAIAIGLVAGLLLGVLASVTQSEMLLGIATGVAPIGTAFVKLLQMVVVPLVAATLFVGVASLGDIRKLGKLGLLTIAFFAATTVVSVLIGMGTMRLMLPLASEAARGIAAGATAEAPSLPSKIDFLLGLIPANPFKAASDGALLPLIVFTCFFGAAVGSLPDRHRAQLVSFGEAVVAAMVKLVHWILWTAPLGVFALAAPVTAQSGLAVLQSLGVFILAVVIGCVVFVALVYVPAVRYLSHVGVGDFLRECLEPQMIAFATTSQAATVPAMLESADRLGLSRTSASFVIALGAAVGRAGSALFQGTSIVFLAWLFGIPIPLEALGAAVVATALVSITVAGVPSASVLTLAPALGAVGVPIDGLGVLLGVDRIPDMVRTATNVTGTMTASSILDRITDATQPSP